MPTSRRGNEGFIEENGKRVDAPIHEPILNGINKETEKHLRMKSMQRAAARGLPPEALSTLFGDK